jgi:uncharacterized membrane protein
MLPAVLAFIGLLMDGGALLLVRRQAQVAADAAALATAGEVDWTVAEAATNLVRIDTASGPTVGNNYGNNNMDGNISSGATSCVATPTRATCTVTRSVGFVFMPVFGINDWTVTATSNADMLVGISAPGQ